MSPLEMVLGFALLLAIVIGGIFLLARLLKKLT